MGGASSSSYQVANQNISEIVSNSCQITCDNTMNDVGMNNIGSNIKNASIYQTCSVNGQCVMANSMKSVADLVFKAKNAASSDIWYSIFGSSTLSYQEINQSIQQVAINKCKIGSSNDMNNVFMYNVNSQIGNATIGQSSTVGGSCVINNILNTTASASGIADNCAASGKSAKKKKTCKGKGGGIGTYILYFIVGMIAFTIVMMVIKFLRGNKLPPCTKKTPQGVPCDPNIRAPLCSKAPKGAVCEEDEDSPLKHELPNPLSSKETPRPIKTEIKTVTHHYPPCSTSPKWTVCENDYDVPLIKQPPLEVIDDY